MIEILLIVLIALTLFLLIQFWIFFGDLVRNMPDEEEYIEEDYEE